MSSIPYVFTTVAICIAASLATSGVLSARRDHGDAAAIVGIAAADRLVMLPLAVAGIGLSTATTAAAPCAALTLAALTMWFHAARNCTLQPARSARLRWAAAALMMGATVPSFL